jgi:predicted O-methyltransferase YrrM
MTEPTTDEAMAAWIATAIESRDRYIEVARDSEVHRAGHPGCELYPSMPGQLLAALAASTRAQRILEIGGGYGYSALWLASSGTTTMVETIEADEEHSTTLAANARRFDVDERVAVLLGNDRDILPGLSGPYDFVFYDAAIPGPELIEHAERLLRPCGTLLASNVFLGRHVPDHPDLERGAVFRATLLESTRWQCAFVNGKLLAVLNE